jgi:hypothetical protein
MTPIAATVIAAARNCLLCVFTAVYSWQVMLIDMMALKVKSSSLIVLAPP